MAGIMEITTVIGCCVDCRCCPQKLFIHNYFAPDKNRTRKFDFETYKKCIDRMPKEVEITFSGFSEPFQHEQCADMILYAHEQGHPVALFTTMIGMTEEAYEKIKSLPFTIVVIHISDEEVNSHIPVTEEWKKMLARVIEDHKKGVFKISKFSCHGTVHHEISDMVYASGIKIDQELHDRAGNLEEEGTYSAKENIHKGWITCASSSLLDRNVMFPDGTVTLCSMDFGLRHVLGNILTEDYETLMTGPKMQEIMNCLKSEKNGDCLCRNCVIAKTRFDLLKSRIKGLLK